MAMLAPQPVETTQSPLGEVVPPTRHRFAPSPLNRRRWQNFKANRRGYWSFWIFMILFVVSLFAELIANDRPFMIKYDGHLYWPAFVTYSETTFGGDFETAADYRDPYLQKQIAEKGGTVIWPLRTFSWILTSSVRMYLRNWRNAVRNSTYAARRSARSLLAWVSLSSLR